MALAVVHSVVGTAANVNDVTQAGALLHGDENDAFGDAGYRGVHKIYPGIDGGDLRAAVSQHLADLGE